MPREFQLSGHLNRDETYKHMSEPEGLYMNSHQLLDVLRKCNLNWFEFVTVVHDMLGNNVTNEAFQQLLLDFGGQLSYLGISIEDERLIEQSRQAYLLSERLRDTQNDEDGCEINISGSESSEDEMWMPDEDILGERVMDILKKKRAALKRKSKREVKKLLAEKRFQKRRRSKRVSKLLKDCPDIGQTVEKFVKESNVGADSWRRTGVLTFDGNQQVNKKGNV